MNTNLQTADTNLQSNIDTNTTAIASLQSADTVLQSNIDTNSTAIASLQTADTVLQTNIDTKLNLDDYQPKIDTVSSGTFASNSLDYTFDEATIYMNQLSTSAPFELNLTISNPSNNKTYKQKIIIDCLEFKGYVNLLQVNNETVEIKYLDGDSAINLAPIAGYSNIMQTLELTRINDTWFCLSKMQMFFNSDSNMVYDETPPVLTLIGNSVVSHEINSGTYSDPGVTAMDNVAGDITNDIVVTGDAVDHTTLGAYTIIYTVSDQKGNTSQISRVVNIADTINPVVTLIGDSDISLSQYATYTELGATASDNSNETLTVVITNQPDMNIAGDYTVLYTATDSTGNNHQVGRLVHVVGSPWILEYSNPTTEIFSDLANLYTNMPYFGSATTSSFTMTGNVNNYLNGDYSMIDCWHHAGVNSLDSKNLFNSTNVWSEQDKNASISYTDSVFGFVQPPFDRASYMRDVPYQGHTDANGKFIYYTHTVSGSNYTGMFHTINLPFFVEPSKAGMIFSSAASKVIAFVVAGSNDDGVTWDFLGESTSLADASSNEFTISTTNRYNSFKFIYTMVKWNANNIDCKQLKIFGDVYSYNV